MRIPAVPQDDRLAVAWQAFRDVDEAHQAPPHLEAAVLAALHAAPRRPAVSRRRAVLALAAAAAVAVAVSPWLALQRSPAPRLLEGRAMPVVPLPAPIASSAAEIEPATVQVAAITRPSRLDEPTMIWVIFDPLPAAEPLQLVRLRVPSEALLALGVALFEPDAQGLVAIDMLVGEDGLPKQLHKVRVVQEER